MRISPQRRAERPQLWNGRVVLAQATVASPDRSLTGTCFETDFASFLAWRDWGFPDARGDQLLRDGGAAQRRRRLPARRHGRRTPPMRAASIFRPARPSPATSSDGRLDLAGSVTREVAEETGLTPDDYAAEAGLACGAGGPAPRADEDPRGAGAGGRAAAQDAMLIWRARRSRSSPNPHRARAGRFRSDDAGLRDGFLAHSCANYDAGQRDRLDRRRADRVDDQP